MSSIGADTLQAYKPKEKVQIFFYDGPPILTRNVSLPQLFRTRQK